MRDRGKNSDTGSSARSLFPNLTERQAAAVELIANQLTSKEAARILNISPYTVDQRIDAARRKLGIESRRALIVLYDRLRRTYQRSIYEESDLPAGRKGGYAPSGTGANEPSESITPLLTQFELLERIETLDCSITEASNGKGLNIRTILQIGAYVALLAFFLLQVASGVTLILGFFE